MYFSISIEGFRGDLLKKTKKEFYKYFLILAFVLLLVFIFRLFLDFFILHHTVTMERLVDRLLDYLLPSMVLFVFGLYYKNH